MAYYKIYVLNEHGHSTTPPEVIDCEDDQEATHHARQHLDGKPIEIWIDARRIARINPGE